MLDVLDFDFGAGVLAEHDGVALLDEHLHARAVVEHLAWAHGNNFAVHGAFLGAFRKEETTCSLGFGLKRLDEDAIFERADLCAGHC